MITVGQEKTILQGEQLKGGVRDDIMTRSRMDSCFFQLDTENKIKFEGGKEENGRIKAKEYFKESRILKSLFEKK